MRNVIFDIGGVLVNCDPAQYLMSFGYDKAKVKAMMIALGTDPSWIAMDLGKYDTYAECVPMFQKNHPEFVQELGEFFADRWMPTVYQALQPGVKLYHTAKEMGCKVYLLSNYSKDGFAFLERTFDFIREVDGRVISSHVGMRKPNADIYQCLLEKYDLKADECIFYDDNPDNIEAAKQAGIHAFLYQDGEIALRQLREQLR